MTVDVNSPPAPPVPPASRPPPRRHPPSPPKRPNWRKARSRLLVLVIALSLVALAVRIVDQRLSARSRIGLSGVTLSSNPVDIAAIDGGQLLEVNVTAQERVTKGQQLAVLQPPAKSSDGALPPRQSIVAPIDGRLFEVATGGATLSAGQLIARLYTPDAMYFRAPVSYGVLTQVRIGMRAHLAFPTLGSIEATLVRVEPRIGTARGNTDKTDMILQPSDPSLLRDVVPGLVLSGWLDARSAPPGAPSGLRSAG